MTAPLFDKHPTNTYVDGLPRQIPGYATLYRMVSLLLDECTPQKARILVLGAGGGQEILALAETHPEWSFDGVDPSENMLQLAEQSVAEYASRVQLHKGYISDAPDVEFDAATSILIFHFINKEERLATLKQLRQRLKVGAPLILVHLSFPQTEPERSKWIARHVAFGQPEGADSSRTKKMTEAMNEMLTILSPEDDLAMLSQAGFENMSLFYAGLSLKGWIAYAN